MACRLLLSARMRCRALASALLGLSLLACPIAAHAAAKGPQQTDAGTKGGGKPAPRRAQPTVHLEAYGELWVKKVEPVRPVPKDPYRIAVTGLPAVSAYEIRLQGTSSALGLTPSTTPDGVARPAGRREVARAVARAQNYRKGWGGTPNATGTLAVHAEETAIEGTPWKAAPGTAVAIGPEVLPRGAGYRVTLRGPAGEALGTVGGTVAGLPTEIETVQRTALVPRYRGARATRLVKVGPEYKVTRSGDFVPGATPWVQPENLLATPAYAREGGTFTKVLGLAAFPRGAELSVHNQTLFEEELARREANPDASKGKIVIQRSTASAAGSAGVEVAARPGDRVAMSVRIPGAPYSSRTVVFKIPEGTGTPVIAARGRAFYPVTDAEVSKR